MTPDGIRIDGELFASDPALALAAAYLSGYADAHTLPHRA
jgi:hypothetical protein